MRLTIAMLLLLPSVASAESAVWTVDRPLLDVVSSIRLSDLSPVSPALQESMPEILRGLPDVIVELYARPTGRAQRYYRVDIHLARPVAVRAEGRLVKLLDVRKRLELWPDDANSRTIVRSTVEIAPAVPHTRLRCLNRLIQRIAGRLTSKAEQAILCREKRIIKRMVK